METNSNYLRSAEIFRVLESVQRRVEEIELEKRLTSHRYEKFLRRQVIILQVKIAGLAACGKIKREMALCIQVGQIAAAKETSLTQAICEMIQ